MEKRGLASVLFLVICNEVGQDPWESLAASHQKLRRSNAPFDYKYCHNNQWSHHSLLYYGKSNTTPFNSVSYNPKLGVILRTMRFGFLQGKYIHKSIQKLLCHPVIYILDSSMLSFWRTHI